MKKLKLAKIAVSAVFALFLVFNTTWIAFSSFKYGGYTDTIPKNGFGAHYIVEYGIGYYVKTPGYPTFTGNLAVSNDDAGISMIIWPLASGGYKYGVMLDKEDFVYSVYVDEYGNAVNQSSEMDVDVVNEYKSEIKKLLQKSDEMWNIL